MEVLLIVSEPHIPYFDKLLWSHSLGRMHVLANDMHVRYAVVTGRWVQGRTSMAKQGREVQVDFNT